MRVATAAGWGGGRGRGKLLLLLLLGCRLPRGKEPSPLLPPSRPQKASCPAENSSCPPSPHPTMSLMAAADLALWARALSVSFFILASVGGGEGMGREEECVRAMAGRCGWGWGTAARAHACGDELLRHGAQAPQGNGSGGVQG